MTNNQRNKCHAIIHSAAVAAAAGNAVPVPGLGIAVDMVTLTAMAMSLSSVLGGNIKEEAAKGLAIAALKRTALQQPIKTVVKEASKILPGLGSIVSASIAISFLEATGWALVNDLENKFKSQNKLLN